jgi:hypothetical protein
MRLLRIDIGSLLYVHNHHDGLLPTMFVINMLNGLFCASNVPPRMVMPLDHF